MARRTSDGHPARRRRRSPPASLPKRPGEGVDLGRGEGEVVDSEFDIARVLSRGSVGSVRAARTKWACGGNLAISSPRRSAAVERGGSSWTSSITTHTSIGASRSMAARTRSTRFAAVAGLTEGGDDRRRQMFGVTVGGLARQPHVNATGIGVVGADGLGQQRRLAEPGAGDDHRQRHPKASD